MTGATTVELVHRAILEEAAKLANQRYERETGTAPEPPRYAAGQRFNKVPSERTPLAGVGGMTYRPDPRRSERGGLCLSVDEIVITNKTPAEIARIHEIGRQAIKEAIVKHKDHFVRLIIGEARLNRNYFDRFAEKDRQQTLF